jgi:hypothetical protein
MTLNQFQVWSPKVPGSRERVGWVFSHELTGEFVARRYFAEVHQIDIEDVRADDIEEQR